jgi:hypothetical protein
MEDTLGHSERRLNQSRGVLRIDDDGVRPTRVARCKFRVITSNLRTRRFTVREKKEVVDGDDLGGGPAGNQQRVSRMNNIDVGRQDLHGWPFAAMPQVIEDADWDSSVDDARSEFCLQAGGWSVLP